MNTTALRALVAEIRQQAEAEWNNNVGVYADKDDLTDWADRIEAALAPQEAQEGEPDRSVPPCLECGAMTLQEAETRCICAGDKDDCHGTELWPDDPIVLPQPQPGASELTREQVETILQGANGSKDEGYDARGVAVGQLMALCEHYLRTTDEAREEGMPCTIDSTDFEKNTITLNMTGEYAVSMGEYRLVRLSTLRRQRANEIGCEAREVTDAWKEAVIQHCIVNCIGWDESDPMKSVRNLCAYEVQIALDPLVSSDAQALIDRGKALATPSAATAANAEGEPRMMVDRNGDIHEECPDCRGECSPASDAELRRLREGKV